MAYAQNAYARKGDSMKIGERINETEFDAYKDGKIIRTCVPQKGKWTVLFFYPLDFTFICPTEIKGFAKHEEEFKKLNAVVIGASTDSVHSHKAWFSSGFDIKFPVIGDTTHKLSKAFDVLKDDQGIAYRGTFIIDDEGVLRYMVVSDLGVGRSVAETLRVLQALQTGELCQLEWKPGEKTLGKA